MSTVKAIVRFPVPDSGFSPGCVVLTSSGVTRSFKPGTRFPVVSNRKPDVCAQIDAAALLPAEDFLKRQPSSNFWMLANRRLLKAGRPGCFIKTPWTVSTGWPPFRFESEGELIYYMETYFLSFREFCSVKVSDMANHQQL